MRFVAFDVETAREAPEDRGGDWNLGVTCAAACVVDGAARHEPRAWHAGEWFGRFGDAMRDAELLGFVHWLGYWKSSGFDVVAWNGCGFDWRVIAEAAPAGERDRIAEMALDTVDPFFQMLCEKGFGIGLDAAAKGMGVEGKTEGMDGLRAIEMWAGDRADQEKVLEYVARDAEATAGVYRAVATAGKLRWTSRSGRINYWQPTLEGEPGKGGRLLTVREAAALPLPDTSWMDDPWAREDFYGWTSWTPEDEESRP